MAITTTLLMGFFLKQTKHKQSIMTTFVSGSKIQNGYYDDPVDKFYE